MGNIRRWEREGEGGRKGGRDDGKGKEERRACTKGVIGLVVPL